jgi:hypothetical protein
VKKHLIIFIAYLLTLPLYTNAALFRVLDFKEATDDLSAVRYPRNDVNDEACAIIKIYTDINNLSFNTRLGIEGDIIKHTGEYWIYVSPREKRIKITSSGFVPLEYDFPVIIESAKVYKLRITGIDAKESSLIPEIIHFNSNPEGAELYLNGVLKGFTPISLAINEGEYKITIRKPLHKLEEFNINVVKGYSNRINKSLELLPDFGSIVINTLYMSNIYIDDIYMGLGEYSGNLSAGEHTVLIKHENSPNFKRTIDITSGETYKISNFPEPESPDSKINELPLYNTNKFYKPEESKPKSTPTKNYKRPSLGISGGVATGLPGGIFGGININLGKNKTASMLGEMGYQVNDYENDYIAGTAHFTRLELGFSYNIWLRNWFFSEFRLMYLREEAISIPWNEDYIVSIMPESLKTDYLKSGIRMGIKILPNTMIFGGIYINNSLNTTRDEFGSFSYYNNENLNYKTIFPGRELYGYDFGIRFIL